MKKYNILLFLALVLASCSEHFLDEEQVGVLKYDYYESEEGIEKLINSCYSALRHKYGGEWTYAFWNYGTDEWKRGDHAYTTHALGGYNDYNQMINPVGEEGNPEAVWAALYSGIDRCNVAIEKIPLVDDGVGVMKDDAGKSKRLGEVRFLRASFLFTLLQQWGAIPYALTPSTGAETEWPKRPVPEVYNAIIDDLQFAYENCPETQSDYGRVTKNAARHYLAKVLLTRASAVTEDRGGNKSEDLARAAALAEECTKSGYNSLVQNFADLWVEGKEINSEIVFSTQFNQEIGLLGGEANTYRNMSHVYWLNQYDTEVGMARNVEYGRPFRRMYITDYACDIHDRLSDSRLRKSLLEVYYSTAVTAPTAASFFWTEEELEFAFTDVAPDFSWAVRYGDTIRTGDPKFTLATANPSNTELVNVGDTALVFLLNDINTTLTDREIVSRGYTIFARYYWVTDRVTRAPIELVDHDTTIADFGIRIKAWTPGKVPSLLKFRDRKKSNVQTYQGTRDFFNARLAETHLIAAECYGRLGNYTKAVEHLNIVRKRAAYHQGEKRPNLWWQFDGGTPDDVNGREDAMAIMESYWDSDIPLEHYTSPSLSKEQRFIEFMLNERCRELLGEMMRWEDLVRTETLYQRAILFNDDTREAGTMREYHKLRPFPQTHLDAIETGGRTLTNAEKQDYQNPGY